MCQPSQSSCNGQIKTGSEFTQDSRYRQEDLSKTQYLSFRLKRPDQRTTDLTQFFRPIYTSQIYQSQKQMQSQAKQNLKDYLSEFDKDNDIHQVNRGAHILPTYPYKGKLKIPRVQSLGYQISILFQNKSGLGEIGRKYTFVGGQTPLGLSAEKQKQSSTIEIEIEGQFFISPSIIPHTLGYELEIIDGNAKLFLFNIFQLTKEFRGSFYGTILGSKLNRHYYGSGKFSQLLLAGNPLDEVKKTIRDHENSHPQFFNANKHILNIKQSEQYTVQLSIPEKRRSGFEIGAYIRSTESIGKRGGKIFFFTAGDFLPGPPNHWPVSQQPLQLRGHFFVNPYDLPKSVSYGINVFGDKSKSQFHLFIENQLKAVFIGDTKSSGGRYSGKGWFERLGGRSQQ